MAHVIGFEWWQYEDLERGNAGPPGRMGVGDGHLIVRGAQRTACGLRVGGTWFLLDAIGRPTCEDCDDAMS